MDSTFQRSFATYLREIAQWRRRRFYDDLRDPRNLQSADGLEQLADYVSDLAGDDATLVVFSSLTAEGDVFAPGQQVAYEIGRFRFYNPDSPFKSFLTYLVDLARKDRGEQGNFGGPQIPGDNPWR